MKYTLGRRPICAKTTHQQHQKQKAENIIL
jgi:hypothetical protein